MLPSLLKKYFFIILIFSFSCSFAGIIKGKFTDAKTGEPLVGATVQIEKGDKKYTTTVNLDGSYTFRNIRAGRYELKATFSGYEKSKEADITLKSETDIVVFNNTLTAETIELQGILVKAGGVRESDNTARYLEKNADIVQNILSQKAIELSPDVTVANSLQRISGVTIQRSSSGEGRYAIIRGMDQRYNSTLVNGIKIPSPDDKYRYVPMDLFPSDLLERLEVIKALTPNMEADAVGGVMNLVMKNAPNKKTVNAFFATGSSSLFNGDRPFETFNQNVINKKSPAELNGPAYFASPSDFPSNNLSLRKVAPINIQAGVTYGDRFFKKRLGFILGLSLQNNYRGSDQILNTQYFGAKVLPPSVTGTLVNNYAQFNSANDNKYSTQQRRLAINNKFDFAINSKNKISLYNLFVHMDEFQARVSSDTDVNTNLGNIAIVKRTRWQLQDIYNSTLHGDHNLSNNFKINWDIVYSSAKQQIPDFAQYEVDYKKNTDPAQPPTFVGIKDMSRIWAHNTDKDIAGYLNLIHDTKIHKTNVQFSWGGLFRHKNRDNFFIKYSLSPSNVSTQQFSNIYNTQYAFNLASGNSPYGDNGVGRNYTINLNMP